MPFLSGIPIGLIYAFFSLQKEFTVTICNILNNKKKYFQDKKKEKALSEVRGEGTGPEVRKPAEVGVYLPKKVVFFFNSQMNSGKIDKQVRLERGRSLRIPV